MKFLLPCPNLTKSVTQALVFVPEERAVEKGWLVTYLRSKSPQEIAAMQLHLGQVPLPCNLKNQLQIFSF